MSRKKTEKSDSQKFSNQATTADYAATFPSTTATDDIVMVSDAGADDLRAAGGVVTFGIDPGLTGGIGTLGPTGDILDLRPMSPLPELAAYLEASKQWLTDHRIGMHVWLEAAQAFPKQGVVAVFSYGTHYGELRGLLVALKIPYTLVRPIEWTRHMHAGTRAREAKAKVRSLEAARRLKPEETWVAKGSTAKKPHDGLVDAYLIAEFGRRRGLAGIGKA